MGTQEQWEHARARLGRWSSPKWKLERLLGVGGTASVYAARHRNGARAAIKILHRELAEDPRLRRRFMREAYIANRIDHPAAVRVIDDEDDPVEPYLVMDLVDGHTLFELVAERPLDEAELLDVAEQLLDLLVVAHGEGIIHRDLKPPNLMLDRHAKLRILDFGIARVLDDDAVRTLFTTTGAIWGTLEFMAPEQLTGSVDASPLSEIYSVGATLFTLASNDPVHDAANTRKRVLMSATTQARSLAAVTGHLSAPTIELIDRALRLDPACRFRSAADMLRAVKLLRPRFEPPDWTTRSARCPRVHDVRSATLGFESPKASSTRPWCTPARAAAPHVATKPIDTPADRVEPSVGVARAEEPEIRVGEASLTTGSLRALSLAEIPETRSSAAAPPPAQRGRSHGWLGPLAFLAVCAVTLLGPRSSRPSNHVEAHFAAAPEPVVPPVAEVPPVAAPAPIPAVPHSSTMPKPIEPAVVPRAHPKPRPAPPALPKGYKDWASDPY